MAQWLECQNLIHQETSGNSKLLLGYDRKSKEMIGIDENVKMHQEVTRNLRMHRLSGAVVSQSSSPGLITSVARVA